MNYPQFKVTVSCMTYNQSKYITDAMNGFTMQQTSFPFVCTIVDDASTDGEQEVIRKYLEDHFDFSEGSVAYHKETDYAHITYAQHKTNKNCYFAVLYLKNNLYAQPEKKRICLKEWREGVEYMAICEGDDYWISETKMQEQVDFLDENREYGLCYTKCKCFDQSKLKFKRKAFGGYGEDTLYLIKKGNPIPTLTVLYRSRLQTYYNEYRTSLPLFKMGDYPFWIWVSTVTKIKFLDEITGVYRILTISASHQNKPRVDFIKSSYHIRVYFAVNLGLDLVRYLYRQQTTKLLVEYSSFHEFKEYFTLFYRSSIKDWRNLFVLKNWLCICLFLRRV